MSIARKIGEGILILSTREVILTFLGFLTTIILIRFLGLFDFGLVTLTLATVEIAILFLDLDVGRVITTDMSKELGDKRFGRAKSLLKRYAQFEILMGFILLIVVFFSSEFVGGIYNEKIASLIRIAAFILFFTGIKNIFSVVFRSHLEFKYISFMNIIESSFRLCFVALALLIMGGGVVEAMIAYPLSMFLSIIISFPLLMRTTKYLKNVETAREGLFFNTLKTHGKWVMSSVPVKRIANNITPWILEFLLGVKSVAIFGVANKTYNFFGIFLRSIESTLLPITPKKIVNLQIVNKILSRSVKYSLWIHIPLIILLWIFAPFIIITIFTESYFASIEIFRILIFIFIIHSFGFIIRPLFYALKAQKYLFYIYLIFLILIVSTEFLIVSAMGLSGVAFALLLSELISLFLAYYIAWKIKPDFKIKIKSFLKIDNFDKKIFRKITRLER
ncbi:MAG: oligosaccharide flippase family protein [Candidatus Aenigmarchaeota archaeon]|nr:oligosaccharide flippase family protein [Candidatus Aenigmarchaeota archaeon]